MTSDEERLAYLNSLPPEPGPTFSDSCNARTDELVASGMDWENAVDQAYTEVRRDFNKKLFDQEGA